MTGQDVTEDPFSTNSSSTDGGNKYMSKKTIAQGMFDVALLSSNTNQLVRLLESKQDPNAQSTMSGFLLTAIFLLITSIILQVIVGGCLIVIATTNRRIPTNKVMHRRLNNVATLMIFFITIINILIPPFTPSNLIHPSYKPLE